MKKILLLATLLFCVIISAQKKEKIKGNKIVTKSEREFEAFTQLEIHDDVELTLKQANTNKIEIEADENLHDVIDTDFRDGRLVVSLNKKVSRSKKFNLTLHVEDLDMLTLEGNSELKGATDFNFFHLDLILKGKADVEMNIDARTINIQAIKKSRAELTLKADSLSVAINESAKLKSQVETRTTSLEFTGSSSIEFTGKTTDFILKGNNTAVFRGKDFQADLVSVNVLDRTFTYLNAREHIEIEAKDRAVIHLYNLPKIELKVFENNVALMKKELSK